MLHAVVVPSTVASGRIVAVDDAAARSASGVVAVMTHRNAPRVNQSREDAQRHEPLPLAGRCDRVRSSARRAGDRRALKPRPTALHSYGCAMNRQPLEMEFDSAPRYVPKRSSASPQSISAAIRLTRSRTRRLRCDQTYRTPTEHHNPMETHDTVAQWRGGELTLHDSTPVGLRRAPPDRGRLRHRAGARSRDRRPSSAARSAARGQTWSHVRARGDGGEARRSPGEARWSRARRCSAGSATVRRPSSVSRSGPRRDGRLAGVTHDVLSETSLSDEFVEACGVFSRDLYAVPNYAMSHALPRLNISKPTYQRGPGESTGSFAIESAMDELAYALRHRSAGASSAKLRASTIPIRASLTRSKHLRECYAAAAQRFEWNRRNPQVRVDAARTECWSGSAWRRASRATHRSAASVRVQQHEDGRVVVGVRNDRTRLRVADGLRAAGGGDSRDSLRARAVRVRRYDACRPLRSRPVRRRPAASARRRRRGHATARASGGQRRPRSARRHQS